MTLEACAELLQRHDPDRFGAVLIAAPAHRPALIALYALNLEIARAPLQSADPLLAEMRLQWWIDRLGAMGQGLAPPLHDVLTPVWQAWGADAAQFTRLAEARRRDALREPFATPDAVADYVAATAAELMWQAAHRLGLSDDKRGIVTDQAVGAGIAAWLRALPHLRQLGLGLAQDDDRMIAQLAQRGLHSLDRAAQQHQQIAKPVAAALYAGPGSRRFLRLVAEGRLKLLREAGEITPFQRRASLAWLALTGRWWV